MQSIQITCTDSRGKEWTEDYKIEDHKDAQKWSEATIASFNDTLRRHELPRTLVKVEVLKVVEDKELSLEEFWDALKRLGNECGENVWDKETWCEGFYEGWTAEEVFYEEFPEHKP